MKRLFLAGACTLALSGCALIGGKQDIRVPVGKAVLVTELATTGANTVATSAANSNGCHGACAVSVKSKLDTLNKAVAAAYKAWLAGNTALAAATVADAMTQAVDVSQQAKAGGE